MAATASLPSTEIFGVLSNQRRQFVLRTLERTEESIDLGDLATEVAALEKGVPPAEVTPEQRKPIYSSLLQTHLPKLDETGSVAFDSDRKIIYPTEETHRLTVYLEVVPGNELAWRDYYLLLGLFGCSLSLAVLTGIYPQGQVSGTNIFAGYAVLVTASALVHRLHDRTIQLVTGHRSLANLLPW